MLDNDYYYFVNLPSLENKLKNDLCKSCADNGERHGTCKKCLENRAWNINYIQTHAFICDRYVRHYHSSEHDEFKRAFLREDNEHPYLYYGIELEISFPDDVNIKPDEYYDEDTDERDRIIAKAIEICPIFCVEEDGSVENGQEFISRPCSIAYWTNPKHVQELKDMLEYLRSEGAYVNQPDSNGFHIHVSRKFFDFGETKLEHRDDAYKEFDWFFQFFQPQLEQMGRRNYTMYCASRKDKVKNELKNTIGCMNNVEFDGEWKIKKGGSVPQGDHYSSVNLNRKTIEARIFKSTTDYKEVLATIELVRNICHAVRNGDKNISFDELLHTKDNLFLDDYLNSVRKNCYKKHIDFDLTTKAVGEIAMGKLDA